MKLIIRRSQAEEKSFFGGHKGMKFLLSCRTELTPQEQDLIKQYKAEEEMLTSFVLEDEPRLLGIKELVSGTNYQCKDVTTLLEVEDRIKTACKNFKTLLEVMSSFGGEEVVEF